tara:strand:- start:624 stop:1025 length:402 start_codon:yes stop_codon:yes gene_type:complete
MRFIILVICMMAGSAYAESLNLQLPSAPGSYQSDKFKSGQMDCSNAIGSTTTLEFGVTGLIDGGRYDAMNDWINDKEVGSIGVYSRIVIPLGSKPKKRIDCNRLYELELQKKSLELEQLRKEIQSLKELQFEE